MELRKYQEDARTAVEMAWEEGSKRVMMVLPTGTGKTIVFSKIAEDIITNGGNVPIENGRTDNSKHVLILAHREELLSQAIDKIKGVTGLECALERAESRAHNQNGEIPQNVVVASVSSLKDRLSEYPQNYFDAVIVDETQHATAVAHKKVIEYFSSAKVLGVTATPERTDNKRLEELFEKEVYRYSLLDAIEDGFLSPIAAKEVPISIDLRDAKETNGDFRDDELEQVLEPHLEEIARSVAKEAADRKIVVFLPTRKLSKEFSELLNAQGLASAHIDGQSRNRAQIEEDYANGKYNVLCNSMLLTEGWDCPEVDCVVNLRATKNRAFYSQIIGRGTRLSEGKRDLLILDYDWKSKGDVCHPSDLICGNRRISHQMTENIKASSEPVYLNRDEMKKAIDQVRDDLEKNGLKKTLDYLKQEKHKVDYLQFAMSIGSFDIIDYRPAYAEDRRPITQEQKRTLEDKYNISSQETIKKDGVLKKSRMSRGLASLLIKELDRREAIGYSSPTQIRYLEAHGFNHVGEWSKEDAERISRLVDRGSLSLSNITPLAYSPRQEKVDNCLKEIRSLSVYSRSMGGKNTYTLGELCDILSPKESFYGPIEIPLEKRDKMFSITSINLTGAKEEDVERFKELSAQRIPNGYNRQIISCKTFVLTKLQENFTDKEAEDLLKSIIKSKDPKEKFLIDYDRVDILYDVVSEKSQRQIISNICRGHAKDDITLDDKVKAIAEIIEKPSEAEMKAMYNGLMANGHNDTEIIESMSYYFGEKYVHDFRQNLDVVSIAKRQIEALIDISNIDYVIAADKLKNASSVLTSFKETNDLIVEFRNTGKELISNGKRICELSEIKGLEEYAFISEQICKDGEELLYLSLNGKIREAAEFYRNAQNAILQESPTINASESISSAVMSLDSIVKGLDDNNPGHGKYILQKDLPEKSRNMSISHSHA